MSSRKIYHVTDLHKKNKDLLASGRFSDVTLLVDGKTLAAHRVILASQSPVFDRMLNTDFKDRTSTESNREVFLIAPYAPFKILFDYLYTGTMDLTEKSDLELLHIFELSHGYSVPKLEKALYAMVDRMIEESCIKNWTILLNSLHAMKCKRLEKKCWDTVTMHAEKFVASKVFVQLREQDVLRFFFVENVSLLTIDKYKAISKWLAVNVDCQEETKAALMAAVDLNLLSNSQLIKIVGRDPTQLFSSDDIMKVLTSRDEDVAEEVKRRPRNLKFLPEVNVCTIKRGARVLHGWSWKSLFEDSDVFCEPGKVKGRRLITVKLGSNYLVNFISFTLNQKNLASYSIYTSVSEDFLYQNRLGFYGKCTRQQTFCLERPKEMRFITIVGRVECNNFQVFYKHKLPELNANAFVPGNAYTHPPIQGNLFHETFIANGVEVPDVELPQTGVEFRLNQPRKLKECRVHSGSFKDFSQMFRIEYFKSDYRTVVMELNVFNVFGGQIISVPMSKVCYAIKVSPVLYDCRTRPIRLVHFEASG